MKKWGSLFGAWGFVVAGLVLAWKLAFPGVEPKEVATVIGVCATALVWLGQKLWMHLRPSNPGESTHA